MFCLLRCIDCYVCSFYGDLNQYGILRTSNSDTLTIGSGDDDLRPVSATTNSPCVLLRPLSTYAFWTERKRQDKWKERWRDEKRKENERHFSSHGILWYCDWTSVHVHTYSVHTTALSGLCFIIARSRVASRMMILSTGIILLCSSESCSMESMGSGPSPKCPNRQEQTATIAGTIPLANLSFVSLRPERGSCSCKLSRPAVGSIPSPWPGVFVGDDNGWFHSHTTTTRKILLMMLISLDPNFTPYPAWPVLSCPFVILLDRVGGLHGVWVSGLPLISGYGWCPRRA